MNDEKKSWDESSPLSGAVFQLKDQNGNTVEDQVLNPGTPEHYALDTYYQHPD